MAKKFNLSNLNPGRWFDFGEVVEGEDPARVKLRVCAGDDLRAIQKKTVSEKTEYHKGERYVVKKPNEDLQNDMIWDFCIVDWEGILNEETGQPLPCNLENKKLLMGKSVEFSTFVADKLTEIREVEEKEEEEAEKK